jgi:type III pantothenate kinase
MLRRLPVKQARRARPGLVLLADIGNSALHLALACGPRIVWHDSVRSGTGRYTPHHIPGLGPADRLTGVAICSVVPRLTRELSALIRSRLGLSPLLVSHRLNTGLRYGYRRPAELGPDRIANAVAALHLVPGNTIVVDMGTATTVEAVTADGRLLGGAILPGLGTMAGALSAHTARLPLVKLVTPVHFLGRSTDQGIRAGIFAAHFAGISRIIDRIEAETRERFHVIATGGLSRRFGRLIPRISLIEPLLTLQGVRILLERQANRRKDG